MLSKKHVFVHCKDCPLLAQSGVYSSGAAAAILVLFVVSLSEPHTYGIVLDNFWAIFIYRTYGPFVHCANIRMKVKRTFSSRKQELHMKRTPHTEVNATMVIYCFDSNYLVTTPSSTASAHKHYRGADQALWGCTQFHSTKKLKPQGVKL